MRLTLKGISHRTAPIELREELAIGQGRIADATHALLRVPGVREGMIISTCNRLEVVVCHDEELADLTGFLADYLGIDEALFAEHTYEYREIDVVRHLFRVASSLDSLIVGEPQILGQVKDAYHVARSVGAVRSNLERLAQSTFSVAKKVRGETKIGNSSVSVASVAIDLVRKVFGSLSGKRVLLVGAGKMSELAAAQLLKQGTESIVVANRTYENAVALAGSFGGDVVRFEHVQRAAVEADIVITSTGAPEYIFRREHGRELMRLRKNRPLFFMDIAVPRDVDPEIHRIEGIFVYDIDDLQSVASSNREDRNREAEKAELIVAQEAVHYHRQAMAPDVAPIIRGLQATAEAKVQAELSSARSKLRSLTPDQQRTTEQLMRGMMNKFLHPVIKSLNQAAQQGDVEQMETICAMFDLKTLSQTQAEDQTETEAGSLGVAQLSTMTA